MIELRREVDSSRRIYNEIYHQRGIRRLDSFFLWILDLLRPQPGQKLLDVSCGAGQMARFASQYGLEVYALDLSDVALQITRGIAPQARETLANAEQLPYADASFDYITNLGSLVHYDQPESAVAEMARVLRTGGKACVSVLNLFGLRTNVINAWRTGAVLDDGYQPIQRYGTREGWQRILEREDLAVEQLLGYEYERALPRTTHDVWNYLRSPRRLVSALLVQAIPVNLSSTLVYVCRKRG